MLAQIEQEEGAAMDAAARAAYASIDGGGLLQMCIRDSIIGSRKEGVKPWFWLRDREIYGIITSKNLRPAACAAALSRMGLRALNHAKPQQARFC